MTTSKAKKESFEVYFSRLQDILDKLENEADTIPLEEMLELYQESLKLVKLCRTKLSEAELKIKNINDSDINKDIESENQKTKYEGTDTSDLPF